MNDDWKNFEPRKNAPVAAAQAKETQSPLDLAAIEGMDAESLRKLIRTVLQSGYGIKGISIAELTKNAIKQDDALYEALMLKGITLALNASEWREFNALATFWAERKKGKPQQSLDVTGKIGIVDIVLEAARQRQPLLIDSGAVSGLIENQAIDK